MPTGPLEQRIATLQAALQMIRPFSCLQAGLFTLVGSILSLPVGQPLPSRALRAALVMALVVASGFALNDWADAEGDRTNHPDRPIPSGRLSSRVALLLAVLPAGLALSLSFSLGSLPAALVGLDLLLSASYSLFLKGTLHFGNLAMAFLNASLLVVGALAAGGWTPFLLAITGLVFLFTWAHEVLLNLVDLDGDRRHGVQTTAVRLGRWGSMRLFTLLLLALMLAPVSFALVSARPVLYLLTLLAGLILPLVHVRRSLGRAPASRIQLKRAGLWMALTRATSLLPIAFLRMTLVSG